jgi:hypothetical protein
VCNRGQAILAPRDLGRHIHAVGHVRAIRFLGQRQQRLHLLAQLRLDPVGMRPGQCLVLARVGLDLRSVQRDWPSLSSFISRASTSTCTNKASISLRKRWRNVARVSWSGWVLAAT